MPPRRKHKGRFTAGLFCGLIAFAATLAGPAVADAPLTKGVYGGVITVGRGAAGVRLDMTRAQVIARLGRPFAENRNGYMRYAYSRPGYIPSNVKHGLFDLYLRKGRVRMMIIGPQKDFRLTDGNHIFTKGGVARLKRRYGRRLHALHAEDGEPVYRIAERYLGRTVWTDFWPEHFGADAMIMGVYILFPPA